MKPAPQRATQSLIQIQIPTALTNLKRRKRWKRKMMRKRRVKVGNDPDVACTLMVSFASGHHSCLCTLLSPHKEEEKAKEDAKEEKKEEKKAKDDSPRPRPLHRTCSLFMRSIAPTISKAEIIAVSCTGAALSVTRKHSRWNLYPSLCFFLSSAGGTLASCVFACPTLILSAGWFINKKAKTKTSY